MKFGVMLTVEAIGTNPVEIRDYVQELEGRGLSFVTTPEHVVGAHPDVVEGQKVHTFDKPYFEPFPLLGFIAGATTTLELATSILILPQRQTAVVAKQAAMLDILCGGRLRLGVGVGRNFVEYEVLGEDFKTRGARMEEQIEVLRLLWTQELVTFKGRWHDLDRVGINPLPIQRPIPIWMGSFFGATASKVIDRIGRIGDGWFPQMAPGDDLGAALAQMHEAAERAGRDPHSIGIECVQTIRDDDDPATWLEGARRFRDHGAIYIKAVGRPTVPSAKNHLALVTRWFETVRNA